MSGCSGSRPARRRVVAVTALLAGLAACSSSPKAAAPTVGATARSGPTSTATASPQPTGPGICTILTPAAVTAAVGGTVTATMAGNFGSMPLCNYSVAGSNLGVDGMVQIIHLTVYTATSYASARDAGVKAGDVVVPGVADDAYYDPKVTSLVLHKGDTVFFVGAIFHPPSGRTLDAAKAKADDLALAQAVVTAIGG